MRRLAVAIASVGLGACASAPPTSLPAAGPAAAPWPAQWHEPLPHGGEVAALGDWWRRFDDPLLVDLIDAAQAASPTIASAASRIEQARATRVAAGAALLPSLDATANAARGKQDFINGMTTSYGAGVQASWEIDLFGGRRAARDAAQARVDGARIAWHDARVAVAAEVATSYVNLRSCEAQREQQAIDARSRGETARLTELSRQAGFEAPASAALARASAAQGASLLGERRAQCDLLVKALVALTGLDEPALRTRLTAGRSGVPRPVDLAVAGVPAEALAQRPDLLSAERDWVAAAADVAQARAARLPRITLGGSISAARLESDFGNFNGTLWSIGPVTVSLPLFDGGALSANVDAARARADEAGAIYRGRLRNAVREVEEALVALRSTGERGVEAQTATEGYAVSFRATEARFKGGLASLFELEDARRSALQSQIALIDLQRERTTAWISLYRALGGGWAADAGARTGAAPPAADARAPMLAAPP